MAAQQSTISSHTGRELVEQVRRDDDRGVYCPDCGSEVTASKGSHPAPDGCKAGKVWGWQCRSCQNTFPSNALKEDAPTFNDRITAIKATPRGGEERWIPVPASAVGGE